MRFQVMDYIRGKSAIHLTPVYGSASKTLQDKASGAKLHGVDGGRDERVTRDEMVFH